MSTLTLIAVVFWFGTQMLIYAQAGATTASVTGTINDEQNKRISGATVTAKNISTNVSREVVAGEDGTYAIRQLPPGSYELNVSADGFKAQTTRVDLELGMVLSFNPKLVLGTISDVIDVRANTLLEEGKTESSTNQDIARIDGLPINRRDFLDFALTSPRVTRDRLPPNGVTATSGLSFNSQSARLNNVTLDGHSNNENFTGGVQSTVSQDAVQEFQIVSDSYSAEFGRAVGGVVNIITRSGSNDYHGTLFSFIRNDELAARDTFASFEPNFEQYQFGTTLSGPIKKDKAFFFTSFERLSVKQNLIVTIPNSIVASAARQGYPEVANGPIPFSLGTTNVLARADIQLLPQNRLSLRYNGGFVYNGAFETIGGIPGGLVSPTTSGIQNLEDNAFNVNNIYVGNKFVNETRFLYSRRDQKVRSADFDNALVLLNTNAGQVAFGRNFAVPQMRLINTYQIVNNVSAIFGRHQLKFGGDFSYVNAPDKKSDFPIVNGGFYTFTPINFAAIFGNPAFPSLSAEQTFDPSLRTQPQKDFLNMLSVILPSQIQGFPAGVPLANIALPAIFAQNFGDTTQSINQKLFSAFLQDDIKVRPNFLFKAGIRYDIFRESFIPKNNGNIAPRIGLSYTPGKLPNLNIRAFYGIFFGTAPSMQTALISSVYSGVPDTPQSLLSFLPFPFSVFPFQMPGHRFPEGVIPQGVPLFPQLRQTFLFQPDFKSSYSQQGTLGISYLIGNDTKISIDYNFVRGLRLFSARFINPVVRPIPGDPTTSSIIGRVNPNRGFLFEFESAFDSYYHGLSITANRRLSRNVSFLASYTFSKAIDNYNDFRTDLEGANDPLKPGDERGLSLQDARSRFVGSGIWQLNYTKNPILRDFQVSVIADLTSGRPYSLFTGQDTNLNGETVPADRPPGIGRNAGVTPGFATVDLRVSRKVAFNERINLQGTVEFFNLFNRVNIQSFNNIYPADVQGNFALPPQKDGRFIVPRERFNNAFRPRQVQLGLRLSF
jgi:hypothetical protein